MRHLPYCLTFIFLIACSSSSSNGAKPDALGASGDALGAGSGSVACGANSCDDLCCLSNETDATMCQTTACSVGWLQIACDGAEDCDGNACCGSLAGAVCSTSNSCGSGSAAIGAAMCHSKNDCTAGECCIPVTFDGAPYNVCGAAPGC